jgi:hypothetical protein
MARFFRLTPQGMHLMVLTLELMFSNLPGSARTHWLRWI